MNPFKDITISFLTVVRWICIIISAYIFLVILAWLLHWAKAYGFLPMP